MCELEVADALVLSEPQDVDCLAGESLGVACGLACGRVELG